MLVTGSRLPISAPCTHLRNKPCTGDNRRLMVHRLGGIGALSSHNCKLQPLLGCMLVQDLFTTQFVPNRDATPTSWRRVNDSGRHPIPVGAVVVHRQSGDKLGQLRFRHCGSGGHRIRKRTHGARTVCARFRQHPPGPLLLTVLRSPGRQGLHPRGQTRCLAPSCPTVKHGRSQACSQTCSTRGPMLSTFPSSSSDVPVQKSGTRGPSRRPRRSGVVHGRLVHAMPLLCVWLWVPCVA